MKRAADPVKGQVAYEQKCVSCHGQNGEGVKNPDGIVYTYPPLWGQHSYNVGAGLFRLSRLAGYYKACEVILTGDIYDSEAIQKLNAINFVNPDYETLMKNTLLLAEKIASYSIISLKTAKQSLKSSMETTLRHGIETERNIFHVLFSTEDKKIGTEAFLKKKKPIFIDK